MTLLSIIIPAHNEERRIAATLRTITKSLAATDKYEVLVLANGCQDQTYQIVKDYSLLVSRNVIPVEIPARGKGLAVRTGMMLANGKYRYMCDADLSTPLTSLHHFLDSIPYNDLVIGNREDLSSKIQTTHQRRWIGRIFNLLTGYLVPGMQDTQCGFKLFTGEAADRIFAECRINGMAFDVEALYLARKMGMRIAQIPVTWTHNPDSRVRLVRDSARMAVDLARIWMLHAPRMAQVKNELPV
jgi:dolichyl-phosphate beta-glucosyltransferase